MLGLTLRHWIFAKLFGVLAFGFFMSAQAQVLPDYKLHAGDQIEVSVWKEEELQRTVIIRPDGKFTFPLAGEIGAVGRTVDEVRVDIEGLLKKYIPEPVVTVSVTGLEGNRMYVIGQVQRPGSYLMNPQLNVVQALSLAGGMTPFAKGNDILILRNNRGQQQTLRFRMDDVVSGKNIEQNVFLNSGDVVIVP